jgi:GDP-D-mannose 3', 5'-epimerase
MSEQSCDSCETQSAAQSSESHTPCRILVTGGAGMIGSCLVKRLVQCEGYQGNVFVVDNLWRGTLENLIDEESHEHVIPLATHFFNCDLVDAGALNPIIRGNNIDTVIHLADIVAGISYVFANQGKVMRDNLLINSNVFQSIRECASIIRAVVNVGTACSFPKHLQTSLDSRLKECDMYPALPESAYGWSKLIGVLELELLSTELGIPSCSLIFHNVYGAPADFGPRSQVIPSLVRRAIVYPAEGDFVVWGDGSQGRAFLYVDDAVEALVKAMHRGLGHGMIQIGPSVCTSIREVAEAVVKISGKDIEIKYDLSKPTGDTGRCADYSKASVILGWEPKVDMQCGLQKLYNWAKGRTENC